jgi:hypothetical protein
MFNLEQAILEWRRQMLAADLESPAPLDELENHLREDIERQMKSGLSAQEALEAARERLGQAGAIKQEFAKVEVTTTAFRGVFASIGMIFLAFIAGFNIFMAGDYAHEDGSSLKVIGLIDLLLLSLVMPLMACFKAQGNAEKLKTNGRTVWTTQLLLGLCGLLMIMTQDPGGLLLVVVSCLIFVFSRRVQIRTAVALSIAGAGLASALATRLLFWRPALVFTTLPEQVLGLAGIGLGVLFLCSWPYSYRFLPIVLRKPVRRRIQLAFGAFFIAGSVLLCDFISPLFNLRPDSQWVVALVWMIMVPLGAFGGIAFGLEEAAHMQIEK